MNIHCDYCGSAFDPEENAVCPQCGAPWDRDAEKGRVRAAEEKREKEKKAAADTENLFRAADAIQRTVGTVGRAAGSVHRVLRVVFWIIFLVVLVIILSTFFRVFLPFFGL